MISSRVLLLLFVIVYIIQIFSLGGVEGQLGPDYTIYVSTNGVDVDGCGWNTTSPCLTIPSAIQSYQSLIFNTTYSIYNTSLVVSMESGVYQFTSNQNISVLGFNITVVGGFGNGINTTIDLNGVSRLFHVIEEYPLPDGVDNTTTTVIKLQDLNIINGYATNVTNYNMSIPVNSDYGDNGIWSGGGVLKTYTNQTILSIQLTGCSFMGNMANGSRGGVVHADQTSPYAEMDDETSLTIDIVNCTFINNVAENFGGAIAAESALLTITQSKFINNTVWNLNGGAINLYSGAMVIDSTLFQDNRCRDTGGAIRLASENLMVSSISNCEFINNKAPVGGAVALIRAYLKLSTSTFTNNMAMDKGGAVYVSDYASYLNMTQTIFTGNYAGQGGALHLTDDVSFDMRNSSFTNNTGVMGGSIYMAYATGNMFQLVIENNNVTEEGGAIFTTFSNIKMTNVTLDNNLAGHGGSIYCSASKIQFESNVNITQNIDTMPADDDQGEILTNDYNIYCALDPPYTFCQFTGMGQYSSLCGEVPIKSKRGLSGGQLAGIIIGSIAGACVLGFGVGVLIAKSTSIKSYFVPLIRGNTNGDDEDEEMN